MVFYLLIYLLMSRRLIMVSPLWELLFRGEEVFWKVALAIRKAGYDSIFSQTQDTAKGGSPAPLLTREEGLGSRGTKHLRVLIPKRITGITENDRATLQA
jgi:hypothetical protein